MHRWLEVVATCATGAFCASLAARAVDRVEGALAAAALVATVAASYALADLVSGLVHWAADRFGSSRTPLLGPAFVQPFREHHADPRAICAHGFFELNGNTCMAAAPVLAGALVLLPDGASLPLALVETVLVALALFLGLTNLVHRWAHESAPPRFVRALQRRGLVLSPAVHARHHQGRHDGWYCITSGWLNRPLDRALAAFSQPRGWRRAPRRA